jgi:hypothetical protein
MKNYELESIWYEAVLSRLRKITKTSIRIAGRRGRKSKPGPPEYLAGLLTTSTVGVSSVNLASACVGTDSMGSYPGFRIYTIQLCNNAP